MVGCGAVITLVPLVSIGLLARQVFKLKHLTICGTLAGSRTGPPALGFANSLSDSEAPALAYASVPCCDDEGLILAGRPRLRQLAEACNALGRQPAGARVARSVVLR